MIRTLVAAVFLLAGGVLGAAPADYWRDIQPVLAERCQMCHQGDKPIAGFSVTDAGLVSKRASQILAAVSGPSPRMPKTGAPLTADQITQIREWIAAGASTAGRQEVWWSLRPLPEKAASGASIDQFIRAKLAEQKLEPSPEADRRTLIRRLTFDLHGLAPTPSEVAAFVADRAPDAYQRLVDRLLASARYGERWARHWLDAVHYGDTHGYDKDKPRPNAWPYRDWVIRAFNEDKPYPRFVQEQLAGDVLFPDDPHATIATGFLAAGPWDFVGHQELREGTTDKEQTRLLDRDDILMQTMSTFVSMTAHCARCHDHKFDPIPQKDYYRLQAVFAGVDRADRPVDADPVVFAKRKAILERKRAELLVLTPLLDRVDNTSTPELVELDDRIKDAGMLITHIGEPKTAADAEQKKQLEARRTRDRKQRQELIDQLIGRDVYAAIDASKARLAAIDAELNALPKPQFVYSGTNIFDRAGTFRPPLEPRPIHLLNRGSVNSPGDPVTAGALSCVPGIPREFDSPREGERRAGLARWITARENMLAWRSIVNRVWHHHFGTGIVDSPNDFGRMGGRPTHPEMLDWLAVWFRDDARGSLKQLHRLIVTSAAYRQSSATRPDAAKVDADNRLLWRMNRGRLDAESVRDSVLQASGQLDLTMGGPGIQMFWFKNDHSPIYDYAKFDPATPGANRRSIYRFAVRSVADPFMERLDCPDPSLLTPKRSTTLTAIQALALWNNPFMLRMADELAARAGREPDPLAAMTNSLWQRSPDAAERTMLDAHAKKHGLAAVARLLFNSNEFLFVD